MRIVKVSSKKLGGKYYGMNPAADKELNAGTGIKKNEIYIDKNLKVRMLKRTIAHEKQEYYLMTKKNMPYNKADKVAMKFERQVK